MGDYIKALGKSLEVPKNPIIPYIDGDGIGKEVVTIARNVTDVAVECAYPSRKIEWIPIFAGKDAIKKFGDPLPDETLESIKRSVFALKGPLETPVATGIRSLNVEIRKRLDLYACIRPVKYMEGLPTPFSWANQVDMVVFRENTEDVYAGIEWSAYSDDCKKVLKFLKSMGFDLPDDSGIGIKPISEKKTKRLVRKAIEYAISNDRRNVTLVHKGNIMKYTEGAFMSWGYEVAKEFGEKVVKSEKDIPGKIAIKDRICDAMFQQVILRPSEYDVIALPNLNGDYISDLLAALVGGIGVSPGANISDNIYLFEPTHGTAPKYEGKSMANPSSMILSCAMMLEYMGWKKASHLIKEGLKSLFLNGIYTYDLARIAGKSSVSSKDFERELCKEISKKAKYLDT